MEAAHDGSWHIIQRWPLHFGSDETARMRRQKLQSAAWSWLVAAAGRPAARDRSPTLVWTAPPAAWIRRPVVEIRADRFGQHPGVGRVGDLGWDDGGVDPDLGAAQSVYPASAASSRRSSSGRIASQNVGRSATVRNMNGPKPFRPNDLGPFSLVSVMLSR